MEKKKKITPEYIMKCEVAKEIGLWDKIEKLGWKSLTSRESGRGENIRFKNRKEKNTLGKILSDCSFFVYRSTDDSLCSA